VQWGGVSDKTNVQIIVREKKRNKTNFQNLLNWSWNNNSDPGSFSATKYGSYFGFKLKD